jgi:hypothetical protein
MKDDVVYNKFDNTVMVKTEGDFIYVICSKESQQKFFVTKLTTGNCILEGYETWDDDEDRKWILKFRVLDKYDCKPNLN